MAPTMKILNCLNCGQEFEVLKKRKTQKFCTKGCATSYRQRIDDPNYMEGDKELHYYMLGLIITDGCVSKQENKQERMTLRTSDKELAEMLHPLICPERKLYKNKPLKEEHQVSYALINTNEEALTTLKSYGIEPAKSYSAEFPKIPAEYMHHFLRGVIDGDGWVGVCDTKQGDNVYYYKRASVTTASINFAVALKMELMYLGYTPKLTRDKRKDGEVNAPKYYVHLYRKEEIKDLADWLYADANYYLDRKKQVFCNDIV